MKYLVATLAVVAVLAVSAGVVAFRVGSDPALHRALASSDALEWLRADFGLTDAQFAAIKRLHDSYAIVCEEHCREIQEATHARAELKARGDATPAELAAADRLVEQLRLICESAIATHVRQCAAIMSPAAGERYLALVLPKIKDFDHLAAPSVRVDRHSHGP